MLEKAIKKIKESKEIDESQKDYVIKHLEEWYNEKKSIAYLEEKFEEMWEKIMPLLNEAGLI